MKALIVEDEFVVAAVVEEMLQEAGHEVAGMAATADCALQLAAVNSPKVAFVDFHLSGDTPGAAVAHQLRALYGTVVVFLSGDPESCRSAAKDSGALGCLAKPFSINDLSATINIAEAVAYGRSIPVPPKSLQLYSYVV